MSNRNIRSIHISSAAFQDLSVCCPSVCDCYYSVQLLLTFTINQIRGIDTSVGLEVNGSDVRMTHVTYSNPKRQQ